MESNGDNRTKIQYISIYRTVPVVIVSYKVVERIMRWMGK